MNQQKPPGAIEWTRVYGRRGYTWNPVKGCQHHCRWTMPDGTVAECYAETTAEGIAQAAYPEGFEHHYWTPQALEEPLKVKEPAGVFLDSMSDLMGAWVPTEQIQQVLDVTRRAYWHTFQLLTKNAPRLLKFDFPDNVWVGVSAPPSSMFGKPLTWLQQWAMVWRQLNVLMNVKVPVRWMSIEPLSFDITDVFDEWLYESEEPLPLEWVVIGAASRGHRTYQPEKQWVDNLLRTMDDFGIPVFFKGNLKWESRRTEFPGQPTLL